MKSTVVILILFLLASIPSFSQSDTLFLRNGDTLIGTITAENKYIVKIKVDTGWVFIQNSELIQRQKEKMVFTSEIQSPEVNTNQMFLPAGTSLIVQTNRRLTTRYAKSGEFFEGRIAQTLKSENGIVVLPQGTPVIGRVIHSKNGNAFRKAQIQLELLEIHDNGTIYTIETSRDVSIIENYTAERVIGSAVSGSFLGGIFFDEWVDGALIGATTGLVTSLFVENNQIIIPEGSSLEFMIMNPISINH